MADVPGPGMIKPINQDKLWKRLGKAFHGWNKKKLRLWHNIGGRVRSKENHPGGFHFFKNQMRGRVWFALKRDLREAWTHYYQRLM